MCNNERVTSKWVTNFDGAAQLVDAIRFWQRTQRCRTFGTSRSLCLTNSEFLGCCISVIPNNQPMIMGLPMAKVGTSHHPLSTTRDTVMESVNCYSKMTKQLLLPTQTREEENLQKIHLRNGWTISER